MSLYVISWFQAFAFKRNLCRCTEKVKRTTSDFWACGRCGKVYWVGPKSHKAGLCKLLNPVVYA